MAFATEQARRIAHNTIGACAPDELAIFDEIWADYGDGAIDYGAGLRGEIRSGIEAQLALWSPVIVAVVVELSRRAINATVDEIAARIAKRRKRREQSVESAGADDPEVRVIAKFIATEMQRAGTTGN